MNSKHISTISLLFFSLSTFGMDSFRRDIAEAKYHFKRGFKTGLGTSIYIHGYKVVSDNIERLQSNKILLSIILTPYIYENAQYFAHHENDPDVPRTTLSYMSGYIFGLSVGFIGIELLLKYTTPSYKAFFLK